MANQALQFNEMTDAELAQKKNALKTELFNLRYQVKIGRVEKPHRIRMIRREIARIETVSKTRDHGRDEGTR